MKNHFNAACLTLALACSVPATAMADGLPGLVADRISGMSHGYAGWSGLYLSGSVGYGLAISEMGNDIELGSLSTSQLDDISSDGAIGIVAAGYDRQFGDAVFGIFADYAFGELDGSSTFAGPDDYFEPYTLTYDNTWSVGARIGLVRSSNTLWYLTGGYTETDLDFDNDIEQTLTGYFVGGGVEQMLHNGFSLKLEYRYAEYDHETLYDVTTTGTSGCSLTCRQVIDADTEIHSVRFGLAYKFGAREEHIPLK